MVLLHFRRITFDDYRGPSIHVSFDFLACGEDLSLDFDAHMC